MQPLKMYFVLCQQRAIGQMLDVHNRLGEPDSVLVSYAHFKRGLPEELVRWSEKKGHVIMVDSGAFTNMSKPGSVTLPEYMAWLKEHKSSADEYVTLDDIKRRDVTIRNFKAMKDAGLDPLFVDHLRFPLHPFHASQYRTGKRVCWGDVERKHLSLPGKTHIESIEKRAQERSEHVTRAPVTKIHLLGIGSSLHRWLPWLPLVKSFDQASWDNALKYGSAPICLENEDGWPRMTYAKWSKPDKRQPLLRASMKKWKLNPHETEDVRVHNMIQFVLYARALNKRLAKAVADKEDLVQVAKRIDEEPDLGLYEPQVSYFEIQSRDDVGLWELSTESVTASEMSECVAEAVAPDPVDKAQVKIGPEKLKALSDAKLGELLATINDEYLRLADSGDSREPLLNLAMFVVQELRSRGMELPELEIIEDAVAFAEQTTKAVFDDPSWQKLRESLVGTWRQTPEENVQRLRDFLGDKPGPDRLRIVLNYLTGSGFRTGRIKHPAIDKLLAEVRRLRGVKKAAVGGNGELAPVAPSGEHVGRPIKLDEVLGAFKTAVIRMPCVTLVGGLPGHGETQGDIDLLIHGPLDEGTKHVIEFRLGRMLAAVDPELAERMHVLPDDLGGPFTNHVHLFDLVLQARERPEVVRMSEVTKAAGDFPLVPEKHGPLPAVYQLHFRGQSVHGDLRIKVNDHLVGWTLATQKAGSVPTVTKVEQARRLAAGLSLEGNRIHKPLRGEQRLFAVPKGQQPVEWLEVDDRVFPEGEVGGTAEGGGVMIAVAHPHVEFGRQEPYFHEYFLTGDDWLNGVLYLRQVPGSGGDQGDRDAGRAAGEGELYWIASISDTTLPGILSDRAVKRGTMPPDGWSWLPSTLEKETPERLRYWTKKGDEARSLRDELVASGWFTPENVRLVDGQFRRVITKRFLTPPSPAYEPPVPWEPKRTQKAERREFALLRQSFRGANVDTEAPTTVVHWLLWREGQDVLGMRVDGDPLAGRSTATLHRFDGDAILGVHGPVAPGRAVGGVLLNDTKDTASEVSVVAQGVLGVMDESPGRYELDLRSPDLRGTATVLQEDPPDGPVWTVEVQQARRKAEPPTKDGVQVWDPKRKDPDLDRTALEPLALFTPMKPHPRNAFYRVADLEKQFATPEALKAGILVQPKLNGRVVVCETDGQKALVYFEDSQVDRSRDLVTITKSLLALGVPVILVGELIDYDGDTPLPRRDLARFGQPGKVDDARVKVHCFDLVYLGDQNLTATPVSERHAALTKLLGGRGKGVFVPVPSRAVHGVPELRSALEWAGKVPASEGSMAKLMTGTYTLGGVTDSDAKLKLARNVNALVYAKELKKPAPDQEAEAKTWVYLCAIGPVTESESKDFAETIEYGGKRYVPIGRSFSTNVAAEPGDVLRVEVTELLVVDTSGKRAVSWFTPMVQERVRLRPSTVEEVRAQVYESEVKKQVPHVAILKRDDELRYVLGVVLEPNDGEHGAPMKPDAHKDIYSTDDVRNAAWGYLAKFAGVGVMHERECTDSEVEVVESYVAPEDMTVNGQQVRKGSWMLGARILSDRLWDDVKGGRLNAWSIDGKAIRVPEKA